MGFWQARGAVRDGLSLIEHLHGRLARYRRQLDRHRFPLDLDVSVENGRVVLGKPASSVALETRAADDAELPVEHAVTRELGPEALATFEGARANAAGLGREIEAAAREVAERRSARERAVAEGRALRASSASSEARPEVPSRTWAIALLAIGLVALLFESAQLFFPFLDAFAVDGSDLGEEVARAPFLVLSAAGVALIASGILAAAAHFAIETTRRALAPELSRRQRLIPALGAAGLVVLILIVSVLLSGVRHQASAGALALSSELQGSGDGVVPRELWMLITACAPFLATMFFAAARQRLAAISEALKIRRAFDATFRRSRDEYNRLLGEEAFAEARLRVLQAKQKQNERAVQLLRGEVEAGRGRRETQEQRRLEHHSLVHDRLQAALELDAWDFRRAARRAGRPELLGQVAATALVLFFALFDPGCGARQPVEPIAASLVCGPSGCTPEERAAAFDAWSHRALHRKGSTFAIWSASGAEPRLSFAACVPDRWGAGVTSAQAAFLREGRKRAVDGGSSQPAGCAPPVGTDEAVTIAGLDSSGHRQTLEPASLAGHLAVVCDRSSSMLGLPCDEPRVRDAFDTWLVRTGGAAGSTFTLIGVGDARDTAEIIAHTTASGSSNGERVARLLAARARLTAQFARGPHDSAIAEAVSVAAEELMRHDGERRLLVLSDLRQVTPGAWNFERSAPPPDAFVRWLRDRELLGRLTGVPVEVCGFHHRRGAGSASFDARLARAVVNDWAAAFAAMGTREVDLGADCPGDPDEQPALVAQRGAGPR